jgi:hypothetical protein
MTLRNWLNEGRLSQHVSTSQEMRDLLRVVDRDLRDASIEALSGDRRFAITYNAVLQLATVVLRASGYRTSGASHHWITFQTIPELMGIREKERADYFDSCRRRRNIADYDAAGEISVAEARELYTEAVTFRQDVLTWLRDNHPGFFPED